MALSLPRLLFLCLWCWTVRAYILDYSCQESETDKTFVLGAMQSAFKMAKAAHIGLTATRHPDIPLDSEEQQSPDSPLSQKQIWAFQSIFQSLFAAVNLLLQDQTKTPEERDKSPWLKLIDTFRKISSFKKNAPVLRLKGEYGGLGPDDLVIYCKENFERGLNNEIYHPDLNSVNNGASYGAEWWELFNECNKEHNKEQNEEPPEKKPPAAITLRWKFSPQQILICPSTLKHYTSATTTYKHWNNGFPNDLVQGQLKSDPIAFTERSGSSTMDLLAVADLILLHEMVHAVDENIGDIGPDPYGWDNSVEIGYTNNGYLNADNYAFYGFASALILGKPPIYPTIFGHLEMVDTLEKGV